jgi:hypothetical protein
MNYDFSKIGVTLLAQHRSRTDAEKSLMLIETDGKCWVHFHYPELCLSRPKNGKRLMLKETVAAHIIAHSKGGDACVPMCDKCNTDQGAASLEEYVGILEMRMRKLYPRLYRPVNLLYTEFL